MLDTLEKAWDGFCEHATQGWNIGVPPYGYLAERIPHPIPAKRAEGLCKTRLVPDPVRAPVVAEIFEWRVGERLSCQAIADRLDADPDRYPPPTAIGGTRSRGSWSARSVRDILRNPKYTGYMVWNRRGRNSKRGRHNPPDLWVWSKEASHPAIVSLDTYRAAAAVASHRRTSRQDAGPSGHPGTKHTYLLRSYVRCSMCQRRMEGTTRKGSFVYFRCRPRPTSGHDPMAKWPGHPSDVYVSQDKLLPGVLDFLADRVFGPDRRALLLEDLDESAERAYTAWQQRTAAIERTLTDLDARRARLLAALETTDDPDGVLAQDVNNRLCQLVDQQHAAMAELQHHRANPPDTNGQAPELLDRIGHISRSRLETASEPVLRTLFDAFALNVVYDPADKLATVELTISDDGLNAVEAQLSPELGISLARSEGFEPPTF